MSAIGGSGTVETLLGALILIVFAAIVWHRGAVGTLVDMIGQTLYLVLFVAILITLAAFFSTKVGAWLGGLDTLLTLLVIFPIFLFGAIIVQVIVHAIRRGRDRDNGGDKDNHDR